MSKKSLKVDAGLKVDDLLDSIAQDDRFVDALMIRLTDRVEAIMKLHLTNWLIGFLSRLESMVEKATNDRMSKSCETLHQKISTLEGENSRLKSQLEESEKAARLNNLVIHGLPESPSGGESIKL